MKKKNSLKRRSLFWLRLAATILFLLSLLAVDFSRPKDILSLTTLHRLTHPSLLMDVIHDNLGSIAGFLQGAQIRYVLLALGIHLLSIGILCLRWRILLLIQNIRFGTPRLFGYYLIAFFFNNFLPTNIGGDAARVYNTGRDNRMTESFAAVFMDRFIGFIAVFILALAAMAWRRDWLGSQPALGSVAVFALGIAGLLWVLFDAGARRRIRDLIERLGFSSMLGHLSRFYQTINLFRAHRATLILAFALSVIYQFSLVYVNWYAAKAVGAEPSFMTLFFIIQITTLICLIPISINGLGVRESFYVTILSKTGLAGGQVLAFQAVLLLLNYFESIIGGLLFLLQKGIHKQRELRKEQKPVSGIAASSMEPT